MPVIPDLIWTQIFLWPVGGVLLACANVANWATVRLYITSHAACAS